MGAAVGLGMQAASGYYAARQQKKQGIAQERIYDANASIAERDAYSDMLVEQRNAALQREQGRALMGTQLAKTAAGGFIPGQGTPLLIAMDTARKIEIGAVERERVATDTEMKARRKARLMRTEGDIARITGKTAGVSTLLNTAANTSSNAYNLWYNGAI